MDRDRYRGALVGLAVGDAVGTTVEFKAPGSFPPVTDMVGGGPFGLEAGQWTDDSSMALCLAESLVETQRFDPTDQLERYVRWWKDGHWSSTGRCFDIGNSTRAGLQRFLDTGEAYPGDADPKGAGNGPLMKLAPVPMAFAGVPWLAVLYSGHSARTTHGAEQARDAARYFGSLLVEALGGDSAESFLARLHPSVQDVADGSYRRKQPPEIKGGGYVVHALEAALWAFHTTDEFEAGCLSAVNLGDDADTTAAIYGQLAGATYGIDGIPQRWRDKLHRGDEIQEMAERLYELARRIKKAGEVPQLDAPWEHLVAYAGSFDGYNHLGERWGEPYQEWHRRWAEREELPATIDDLRAFLSLNFRSDRFEVGGERNDPRENMLRRTIVQRIRELMRSESAG